MRTKTLPFALLLPALAALLILPGMARSQPGELHFGLARSVPSDKATVHQVSLVTLWFTEAPAEGSVSIRLLDGDGKAVAASDAARDPEDAKAFSIRPGSAPAPGSYTVSWRGMGADGHVVRGQLVFTVAAH